MISNLFDKLSIQKQLQLLEGHLDGRGLRVKEILTDNYFLVELTIGEADTIFRYFYGGDLDLKKLYSIFDGKR